MAQAEGSDVPPWVKARVALAALRGDKSLSDLAKQYNLSPAQIEQWKKQLEQNAGTLFPLSKKAPAAGSAPSEQPTLPPADRGRAGALAAPAAPTPAAAPGAEQREAPTTSKELLDDDFWKDGTQQLTIGPRTEDVAATAAIFQGLKRAPPTRTRKWFAPLLAGWREKHHAAKTSKEMLELYRSLAAAGSARVGNKQQLYRHVVMARLGVNPAAADKVLARATESFATWPVERALTFRDVVHYLAVADYLASNNDVAGWTRENMGRVVASYIPDSL
jgi:transposase-like protein